MCGIVRDESSALLHTKIKGLHDLNILFIFCLFRRNILRTEDHFFVVLAIIRTLISCNWWHVATREPSQRSQRVICKMVALKDSTSTVWFSTKKSFIANGWSYLEFSTDIIALVDILQ